MPPPDDARFGTALSGAEPQPFVAGEGLALHGEVLGEGPPVVLCHGVTATRRYVLHGSGGLFRKGFCQISYDARAHGESDPAPDGGGYTYPELVGDLESVLAQEVGEGTFVLAGHSMGAHTAVAYALAHPEQVAGLVVIGPVFTGPPSEETTDYWDGLARALEENGAEGFAGYLDSRGIDPDWREVVLRITRERITLHLHPEALAVALREVPRSLPFDSMDELEFLEVPALVVASHDLADPGHPYSVAEAYAQKLPNARLTSEAEGESPLAWQGGKLAREIADFCAGTDVEARFGTI